MHGQQNIKICSRVYGIQNFCYTSLVVATTFVDLLVYSNFCSISCLV